MTNRWPGFCSILLNNILFKGKKNEDGRKTYISNKNGLKRKVAFENGSRMLCY